MAWEEDEFGFGAPEEFFGDEGSVEEEFAAEEQWLYQTALDERVCGRCAPLEGVLFSPEDIAEQFPAAENYEDIIFANVHDKCRCQLIRQQGGEGEGDMVEGRGAPLSKGLSLGFAARNPRSLGRFGLRQVLMYLGTSGIIAYILSWFVVPIITSLVQVYTRNIMAAQQRAEEERLKKLFPQWYDEVSGRRLTDDERILRQAYRSIVGN